MVPAGFGVEVEVLEAIPRSTALLLELCGLLGDLGLEESPLLARVLDFSLPRYFELTLLSVEMQR